MKSELDTKIDALRPGREMEISRTESGYCTAERSGDGKTIRFVRHQGNMSTVFHTSRDIGAFITPLDDEYIFSNY